MTFGRLTTDQTRRAWDSIAAGYDEFVTRTHSTLADEALDRVGLRAGMRFLDVAAGSGALSLPAARRGADVLATDISPAMVERLKARARSEKLPVDARVMDGHALDLEDDSFDVAGSQFGVMLFPDLPRGLAEMARVTKPGGRVLMVVFGNPAEVEFIQFFTRAVSEAVPGFQGLPRDPPPLPFQVADPTVFADRLREAGLVDVRVDTVREELRFSSGPEMWNWLMNSNPIPGALIADATDEQRARAVDVLDGLVRERAGSAGTAVLTSPVQIGTGSVRG